MNAPNSGPCDDTFELIEMYEGQTRVVGRIHRHARLAVNGRIVWPGRIEEPMRNPAETGNSKGPA